MMEELANPSEEPSKQTLKILLDNAGPIKHARGMGLKQMFMRVLKF
jgi:hypothetical protein